MATGNSSLEAAEEQRRRDEMREQYDSGLDNVPTARQEQRLREQGVPPDEEAVRQAGFGAAGILGDIA